MIYLKTINLWDAGIQKAILCGQLKLQAGQWVQCGEGKKSRFVAVKNNKTIWAAHWQGSPIASNRRFKQLLAISK